MLINGTGVEYSIAALEYIGLISISQVSSDQAFGQRGLASCSWVNY